MSQSELPEESVIELLKCSICKELVPRSEVRKHTANHFSKTEHICEHCGKCFAQNFNLVNHMRIHTGETPFMCSYCEKTFRTKESCQDHEAIKHTKTGLKHCELCGDTFASTRGLKGHMHLKHGVEDRFQCKWCGGYWMSAEGHRAHEEAAPCKRNQCEECGKIFTQKKDLEKHGRTHLKKDKVFKKDFPCQLCEKAFSRVDSLRDHVRKNHPVAEFPLTFPCNFCGKIFSSSTEFIVHVEDHRAMSQYSHGLLAPS